MLDGYDVLIVAVTIPAMAKAWGLPPAAFGVVLAATTLAMALGASLMGSLGDRFGRRPLIIGSFALAGITTLAVPFVDTVLHLALLRLLTGLGLGASLANALALGAEVARPEQRSRVVTAIYAVSGVGSMIGGIITPWLMDLGGWQGVYLFGGGAPLAVCLILLAALPESPSFIAGGGRDAAKRQAAGPLRLIGGLFAGSLAVATLFIWLLFLVSSFGAYLVSGWLPTLMNGSGWSLADGARARPVRAGDRLPRDRPRPRRAVGRATDPALVVRADHAARRSHYGRDVCPARHRRAHLSGQPWRNRDRRGQRHRPHRLDLRAAGGVGTAAGGLQRGRPAAVSDDTHGAGPGGKPAVSPRA